MKKILSMLSAFTITTTIVPTIVACGNEDKVLDLASLTADSFKTLDILSIPGTPITTKNINEINDDNELTAAIQSHVKVMLLKKVFGLNDVSAKTGDEGKALAAFILFTGAVTPSILDISVKKGEGKQYKITIKKTKWADIKIEPTVSDIDKNASLDTIKPYYDLIKGDQVEITITKA